MWATVVMVDRVWMDHCPSPSARRRLVFFALGDPRDGPGNDITQASTTATTTPITVPHGNDSVTVIFGPGTRTHAATRRNITHPRGFHSLLCTPFAHELSPQTFLCTRPKNAGVLDDDDKEIAGAPAAVMPTPPGPYLAVGVVDTEWVAPNEGAPTWGLLSRLLCVMWPMLFPPLPGRCRRARKLRPERDWEGESAALAVALDGSGGRGVSGTLADGARGAPPIDCTL